MTQDKIEKVIVLNASLPRVWNAIADSQQFGTWFGVAFDAPFVAGARLTGRIVPTRVDPDVAAMQQPYEGKAFDFFVEAIEPMRRIAFRWHPFAIDPNIDYTSEPTTLITFELEEAPGELEEAPGELEEAPGEPEEAPGELEEAPGGTRLTITESGFDNIPLERRAKAFTANEGGWAIQSTLIAKYLAAKAAEA
jgi:uncharacterized protein YndB with AHSA1/START domain